MVKFLALQLWVRCRASLGGSRCAGRCSLAFYSACRTLSCLSCVSPLLVVGRSRSRAGARSRPPRVVGFSTYVPYLGVVVYTRPVLFPPSFRSSVYRALTTPVPTYLGTHRLRLHLGYESINCLQLLKVIQQIVEPSVSDLRRRGHSVPPIEHQQPIDRPEQGIIDDATFPEFP